MIFYLKNIKLTQILVLQFLKKFENFNVIFANQSNQVLEKRVCYQAERTFILPVGHK